MKVHEHGLNSKRYSMSSSNCFAVQRYSDLMDLDSLLEHRKSRLADLVRLKFDGNQAAAGRALGFRDGAYIGQMLKGIRPITEKTIEQIHDLSGCAGWFNAEPVQDKSPNVVTIERRQCTPTEVFDNLEAMLMKLDDGLRDGVAGALAGMAKDPSKPGNRAMLEAAFAPQAFAEENRRRK